MIYSILLSYDKLDSNAITISGFFGALTFTAMILIMQFSINIKFSEILIPWTAIVSFFFILSTIGFINIDVEKKHPDRFRRIIMFCFLAGFYGLIFVIPALVYSFTVIGAIVVFFMELIILIIFNSSIGNPIKSK